MKKRQANIELLRILSMAMVVAHHYLKHGMILDSLQFGTIEYGIYWTIDAFFFVCVNVFVLISGYFLSDSKAKVSRVIRLWADTVLFSIFLTLINHFILGYSVSYKDVLFCIFPITGEKYWFVTAYAIMILISPVLNYLIHAMTKKQFQYAISIIFIVFSFVPTFFVWARDLISTGMDYQWFICLYLIAAYIKKWGINLHKSVALLLYFVCCLLAGLSRIPLGLLSQKFIGTEVLSGLFFRYNSVLMVLAAVSLFVFFSKINIKAELLCRTICYIAASTFAVYLVHEDGMIRKFLWGSGLAIEAFKKGYAITILVMMVSVIVVFLISIVFYWIVRSIQKLLHMESILKYIDLKCAMNTTDEVEATHSSK